jgi:hypothetical protein
MARHFRTHRLCDSTRQLGSICRRRIKAKSLRGVNWVAIIAKAASLVLRYWTAPGFVASRIGRWHARIQTSNRSTHPVADFHARAQRVENRASTLRASYRSAGAGATDCTGRSGSAAIVLDDRSLAVISTGAGDSAARSRKCGADAARISMHLRSTGNLDRVGWRGLVVQLCSRESVRARAVRQLLAECKPAVGVHPTNGIHAEPAKADDL